MEIDFSKEILSLPKKEEYNMRMQPIFYLHYGLISAQRILMIAASQGSIKEGIVSYSLIIEQMEVIAKSSGVLESNQEIGEDGQQITFQIKLDKFLQSPEYLQEKSEIVRTGKLANHKLYLILEQAFANKTVGGELIDCSLRTRKALKLLEEKEAADKIESDKKEICVNELAGVYSSLSREREGKDKIDIDLVEAEEKEEEGEGSD